MLRFLFEPIRAGFANRPGLQNVITNIGWLFFDRALRLFMGFLVGVWVARYLGPEQFGMFNYVLAIVGIFGAIATLGLNGIVVRDLVKLPDDASVTLGTAFFLQIIAGLLAYALALVAIYWARPDDSVAKFMVAILGFAVVYKASEVVKYWFESQVQSKYVVWVENSVFLVFTFVKIILIISSATLLAFVWAVFAEGLFVAFSLFLMYAWRGGELQVWRINCQRAQTLFRDSWPLALSAVMGAVLIRIDQVMLMQMLGADEVGQYSAAARISEAWYFVAIVVGGSVFPSIVKSRKISEEFYRQRMQSLYDFMVVASVLFALIVTLFSESIVNLLYGGAYSQSASVLVIHVWAGIFVFLRVASGYWFITNNLQILSFYRSATAVIINVVLNFILIPIYGIQGAAISLLIAVFWATYGSAAVNRRTRHCFIMQTRALFFIGIINRLLGKLR